MFAAFAKFEDMAKESCSAKECLMFRNSFNLSAGLVCVDEQSRMGLISTQD
jgi:hypothetical protein